ncbi:hypothetical protein C8Q73DRAFT_284699 [Cubamyces lactineus]|nr:hypothetical protein C8Q73DRAFT_284699 [Cubamyces lactineus]
MSGSRTAVKPGTYVIFNAEYGTALSLSPTSPPTLNCRPFDAAGSAYQQWKFVPTDESDHFLIQPMAKSNLSSPRYLTIGGLLREGAKGSVTVGSFPMAWKVTRGEFGLRCVLVSMFLQEVKQRDGD